MSSAPFTTARAGPDWVLVALGSNLGDPPALLCAAVGRLRTLAVPPLLVSSFRWTAPENCPPGSPPFLNGAAAFAPRPGDTPEKLLGLFQQWEKEFGRQPKQADNEPRPLDLDLIAFGRETRQTAWLVLPHPRACQRRFVLEPLCEIAPDFILPGQTKTVAELWAAVSEPGAPDALGAGR